jgi:site-specific recombinase XerD
MSYKDNLFAERLAVVTAKRARCTAETARRYRNREGDPESFQRATTGQAGEGGEDRRSQVAATVWHLFGPRHADQPKALACEPYLRDALYRWLLTTCRTPAAWGTYAARMWRWVAASGRRSLSNQTETTARAMSDFLYDLERGGLSPRSVVSHRDALRSWFAWLFDRDLIRRTPVTRDLVRGFRVDHAQVLKADGTRQAFTPDEAQRVADWCLSIAAPEAGVSILLQLTAGLRSAEVAELERRHLVEREVDGAAFWTLTVPGKGKKQRKVALEPIVVEAVRRYFARRRLTGDRGPLLINRGGGKLSPRQVQRFAKDAAKAVGREDIISSHDLRKTAATLLRKRGAELWQVKDLLGHSSIVLTERCYVTDKPPMNATTGIEIRKANP